MKDYVISRETKPQKLIKEEDLQKVYKIKPNIKKRKSMFEIEEILVINPELQKLICKTNFDKVFWRLTAISISVMDGSDDESDSIIALGEIEHARQIVTDKYQHYLSQEEYRMMIKKLNYLDTEIKNYLNELNIRKQMMLEMMEETKTQGKSR